jgi:hypothetical protein
VRVGIVAVLAVVAVALVVELARRPGGAVGPPAVPVASPAGSPPASAGASPGPVDGPTVTLLAAGDIADCTNQNDEATAAVIEQIDGTVAALGDLANPHGTAADFADCYDRTWGRFKDRTRPVPGTSEYDTPGASAYWEYWGDAAGPRGLGYYSYDLGAWHVVALNSNCRDLPDGCGPDSAQARWLEADLAANAGACVLAYTFAPRFSSGRRGSDERLVPLVRLLYDARASVLLSGHDQHYERFRPMDPEGYPDERGIRQFVVGTGGDNLRDVFEIEPGSEVLSTDSYGVLRLTLEPDAYEWEFIAAPEPEFRDAGRAACRR